MDSFHFIRPWWLLAIILLVVLGPWLWRHLSQFSGWQKVLAPHLSSALLGAQQKSKRWLPFTLIAIAWVLSSLALAGPSWERLPTPAYQNERAAVIIMDMSMNTRASDISPDRLTRLRFKALDLLDSFSATEIGLVAYAGDAFTISPLTRDYSNMRGMIPALTPEIMPSAGNYPLLAFTEAHRMVTDAGYEQAEFFWFSAGMSQDDYQEIRRFLRGKGHRVSSLLAGDDQPTPIRLASGDMLRDSLGRLTMAQLNSSLFERLSNEYNGRTVRLRADSSDIEHILAQAPLQEGVQRQSDNLQSDQWLDRGPYLAWLLVPLALYAARKGVLFSILLLPLAMMLYLPAPAYAMQSSSEPGLRPFSNQQQRAAEYYRQGDYQSAAALFREPMMRGNALYRAGQYAEALDAYQQADDSAERWYNSGNALAQLGELDAASDAYAEALARQPDWQQAADNKAMVDELREQQQQESDDDSQDGDAESEDQQEQNQEQDHSDDAGDDSQSEQRADEDTEQSPNDDEQGDSESADQESADDTEAEQPQSETGEEPTPPSPTEQEQQIQDALEDQQLNDEQRAELEQLLRRVQSDPAILLRNRMQLEAERRQQGLPPRGGRRP